MKITVFNGSHQVKPGNTSVMVDEFLRGASEKGAVVRHIRLVEHRIEFCTACKACWFQTPGRCRIRDGMAGLLEAYLEADVVGFATPLYVDNVSGRMKVFLDRLIATGDPHWDVDEAGECVHRRCHDRPERMIVISNCGYPEQTHFQPLSVIFRRMARNQHLELAGEIYRGGGGLLTRHDDTIKPFIDRYLELVKRAGAEVAVHGRIREETGLLLQRPLLPNPDYAETFRCKVNEVIDSSLPKKDCTKSPLF